MVSFASSLPKSEEVEDVARGTHQIRADVSLHVQSVATNSHVVVERHVLSSDAMNPYLQ